MEYNKLIHERYSCRSLKGGEIEKEKLDAIIDAAMCAPTAKNLQPFKLWVIKGADGAKKLGETTQCIFGAETFIVVGADSEKAWERSFDNRNFAIVDAGIIATHIMLAIHNEGLASTWVGAFDAPKLKELYPAMNAYELVAIFPIGYPADDAAPSPRHTQRKSADETVEYL